MKKLPLLSKVLTLTLAFSSGTFGYFLQQMGNLKYQIPQFSLLSRRKRLLGISIVGLAIRFVLAPFFGHPYDLRIFMAVSWAVANGVSPYSQYVLNDIFANMAHPHLNGSFYGIGYPPPWGLILGIFYQLSTMINPNDIYTLVFSLKIPIIIGDLVTALVIYKILKKKLNRQIAFKAFCLYQFCPFVIVIGSVWGMFDSLVFLFSILSVYLLLEKMEWSLLSLAVACALKPYPIILVPLFSIFIYKQTASLKRGISYLLGVSGFLSLFTFLPMVVFNWPISNLYHAMASHMSSTNLYYNGEANYTYGAASPFNLFNVFKLADPTIQPTGALNYLWIFAIVAVYLYAYFRISEINFSSILNWSFLISLVFFTTRFWVSEQNLIQLFSFFLFVVLFNKSQINWKYIHTLWILLFAFVMIHVPAIAFNWIADPQMLNVATAFYEGPFGPVGWVLMSGLTVSWLALLWRYSIRRMVWR